MSDATHEFDIVPPFLLTYEGRDADRHVARADLLGQSVIGAAQHYNALAHFCVLGFVPRGNYRREFQCYVTPVEAGSLKQLIFIAGEYGLHAKMVNGAIKFVFGQVVDAVKRAWSKPSETQMVVQILTDALLERARGDDAVKQQLIAGLVKSNDNLASLHARLIDTLPDLANATRSHGRRLVAPIGETCSQLTQLDGDEHPSVITEADAAVIRGDSMMEVQDARAYRLTRITELNLVTGHCLVDAEGLGDRIPGKITDPALRTPGNPYSAALHGHTDCTVNAKVVTKEGAVHRLFISDTVKP